MNVELAIITNSFNRKSLFQKAVAALEPVVENLPFGVVWVVFEAGSNDGSVEWIREEASKKPSLNLRVIQPASPSAGSFADGCNQAVTYAASHFSGLQWCLFYETDNQMVNHEALEAAVRFLTRHPQIGGVGFTVEYINGVKAGYGCRFPRSLSFVAGQQLAAGLHLDDPQSLWRNDSEGAKWTPCDVVYTSPLLIRYQAWVEAGPMDALNFPFTDSDVEWCWRASKHGWPMAVLDLPGVVHDNGGTVSDWSGRRVLWFHQSRMRLLSMLFPWQKIPMEILLFIRHLIEAGVLLMRAGSSERARKSLKTRLILLKDVFAGYENVLK